MPPNVEPWEPELKWSITFFELRKADIGIMAPPKALPRIRPSGIISSCWNANNLPVRPNPDWISSRINKISFSLHNSLNSWSHPFSGTLIPASPWIGSTNIAQVFLFIFSLKDSIDSLVLQPDQQNFASTKPLPNGPKPFLYDSSDEKPTMVVVLPWKFPSATIISALFSDIPLVKYPHLLAAFIAVSTASAPVFIVNTDSNPDIFVNDSRKLANGSV